jgi:hypothetical protein
MTAAVEAVEPADSDAVDHWRFYLYFLKLEATGFGGHSLSPSGERE